MLKKFLAKQDRGFMVIAALLTALLLAVLVLALLLQSQTEYVIAINEQDSAVALNHAEGVLEWSKRRILDSTDLTSMLRGPDGLEGTPTDDEDNNMLEFRTLNTALTPSALDGNCSGGTNCERTVSTVWTDTDGTTYEAFRIGRDTNGDTNWDGPRALLYVRVDDNYDEAPATNDPLTDSDFRVRVTVLSEYPIFVDANGNEVATMLARGRSRKKLVAKFGVGSTQPAIISNRSLMISGNPTLCGDCGSVHANVDLFGGGDIKACHDVTASLDDNMDHSGTVVNGTFAGGQPTIPVPVINPYDNIFVPVPADFTGMDYSCTTATPKYFAFVPKLNGNSGGLVYKAYWDVAARPDNPDGGWKWRLIEDLNDSHNTLLDNCGRVVSAKIGAAAAFSDTGAGSSVNDNKTDEFYGFKMSDTYTFLSSCSGDTTLCTSCTLADNDFNTPDFYRYSTNAIATDPDGFQVPMLPGSFDSDGARDFSNSKFEEGKARWVFPGNLIYSPLQNAVIFIYGALNVSGNAHSKICSSSNTQPCTESNSSNVTGWKVSFITVSSIEISGNPSYAPAASPNFPFLLISGRDISISGNPTGSNQKCNSVGAPCAVIEANNSEFAGIIAAHEQIKNSGNYSFDGFMIIEDAVNCATTAERQSSPSERPLDFSGNPNIHYDCVNPPNPWGSSMEMTSWQEVQEEE